MRKYLNIFYRIRKSKIFRKERSDGIAKNERHLMGSFDGSIQQKRQD